MTTARTRLHALWTERGWACGTVVDPKAAPLWTAWADADSIHFEAGGPTEDAAIEALLAKLEPAPKADTLAVLLDALDEAWEVRGAALTPRWPGTADVVFDALEAWCRAGKPRPAPPADKAEAAPEDLEHSWRCERASRIELQRLLAEARAHQKAAEAEATRLGRERNEAIAERDAARRAPTAGEYIAWVSAGCPRSTTGGGWVRDDTPHEPLRCLMVSMDIDTIHKGAWTLRLPPLPEVK